MTIPFTPEAARLSLVVRHLQPDDDMSFIADEPGLSPEVAQHRADQRWLLNSNLPTCWVATDVDGAVCYMVWFLTAKDNELIRSRWGNWLPQLGPDEALVEGIYVAPSKRGLGIMTEASCEISNRFYEELGLRYMIGYIGAENVASLRAGEKAGYLPYLIREDRWRLFRRRVRFIPVDQWQPPRQHFSSQGLQGN